MLSRLPRRLSRITEQLEDGTLALNVRAFGDLHDRAWLAGLGDQFILTVLASVLGIAGVFLLTREGGAMMLPTVSLWQFFGLAGLFLAFTLGARVLANIFFHVRD